MELEEESVRVKVPAKKTVRQKLIHKVLTFDMYSQPLNLVYKQKTTFYTGVGIFLSLLTMLMCSFILINSVVFYSPKNTCQYNFIEDSIISDYQIDLIEEFFFFIAAFDKITGAYVDTKAKELFLPKLTILFTTINNGKIVDITYNDLTMEYDNCNIEKFPTIDENVKNILKKTNAYMLCPKLNILKVKNFNVYLNRLYFYLANRVEDPDKLKESYENLVLQLYFVSYTYNEDSEKFTFTYKKIEIDMKEVASNRYVSYVYNAKLEKETYIIYNGYLNLNTKRNFFFLIDNLKLDNTTDMSLLGDSNNKILNIIFDLPYSGKVYYFQKFSFLSAIGQVSGWLFLVTTVMGLLVRKCARLKLYESIANDAFSLISSDKNLNILDTIKSFKEKSNSNQINSLDLVVDDAHKYTLNDQLRLNFFEIVSFLFCFDCFKSSKTKSDENTLRTALEELYKSIDIVNVVRSCQEVRLLKEIIFEPYQKNLFDNLIHPIVTSDEVKSAYSAYFMEIKAKNEQEKDGMSRANLKDALIQLSSADCYSEIDYKIINLLFIQPEFKKSFFKLEEKQENIKLKYFSLIHNPKVHNKQSIVINFEKYVKELLSNIEEYKVINNDLIEETNDIMRGFTSINEENKILKQILYGNKLIENGYVSGEIIQTLGNSYHPIILPKEKSTEQLEFSRNINIISQKGGILYIAELVIGGFFEMLDAGLCIKSKIIILHKEHNVAVQQSFAAIQHCIRIGFLSFIVFFTFFVKTLVNNVGYSECKVSLLCYGFLSFHQKPDDIVASFVFSVIFNLMILLVYTLNITIKYYLTDVKNEYIQKNFEFSRTLFTAPNLKVVTEEDSKTERDYFMVIFKKVDDNLKDKHFKSTMVNLIIFFGNFLTIGINSYFTLFILKLLKKQTQENYGLKTFLISLVLTCSTNFFPILNLYLVKFHKNILPSTIHLFQFWFPFSSKFIAYLLFLIVNMQIFMYGKNSEFKSEYAVDYYPDLFTCREDQTAYNLIMFMMMEVLFRRFFLLVFSFCTRNKRYSYSVEYSVTHTMCTFLLMSAVTVVYPIQGIFTFFIFIIEYHTEYLILTKFKSKPHTHLFDTVK